MSTPSRTGADALSSPAPPSRAMGPAARHYADRDDPDSQKSPPDVRIGIETWMSTLAVDEPTLDLGCGTGSNLVSLRRRLRCLGSEISSEAARSAGQVAPVVVADGARLPFVTGSLGSVICTEVLEHVDDPSEVLAEMARVLRGGGLAYVTTPNYANLAGVHKWLADRRSRGHDWNPWGAHKGGFEAFMTGRRLARAARPHLEILSVRGLDFGQAMTGRFRPLDRLAWSWIGRVGLPPILCRLDRPTRGPWRWHGMHVELLLRRPAGGADQVVAGGSFGARRSSSYQRAAAGPSKVVYRSWSKIWAR